MPRNAREVDVEVDAEVNVGRWGGGVEWWWAYRRVYKHTRAVPEIMMFTAKYCQAYHVPCDGEVVWVWAPY